MPDANFLGCRMTPVHLHKIKRFPVRETVLSFLHAAVKELHDKSGLSVLLHVTQKTTYQSAVFKVSSEDQRGILAAHALQRDAEILSRNTFHVVVSCCQRQKSCRGWETWTHVSPWPKWVSFKIFNTLYKSCTVTWSHDRTASQSQSTLFIKAVILTIFHRSHIGREKLRGESLLSQWTTSLTQMSISTYIWVLQKETSQSIHLDYIYSWCLSKLRHHWDIVLSNSEQLYLRCGVKQFHVSFAWTMIW